MIVLFPAPFGPSRPKTSPENRPFFFINICLVSLKSLLTVHQIRGRPLRTQNEMFLAATFLLLLSEKPSLLPLYCFLRLLTTTTGFCKSFNVPFLISYWTINSFETLKTTESGAVPPHSTDKSTPPSLELSPPEHPHPHSCSPLDFSELCPSLGRKSWRTKRPEVKLFLSDQSRACLLVSFIQ